MHKAAILLMLVPLEIEHSYPATYMDGPIAQQTESNEQNWLLIFNDD